MNRETTVLILVGQRFRYALYESPDIILALILTVKVITSLTA
jgi:hypothetical protein